MESKVIEIDLSGAIVNKIDSQIPLEDIYYSITELDTIYSNKLSSHLDLKQYAVKLYDKANFIVCRNNDNIIVGIIAFYLNIAQNLVYVTQVCVNSNLRRQGIASKMLVTLIRTVENTFKTIALEVTKTNINAIALYEKFGFKKTGERGVKLYMDRKGNSCVGD